MKDSSPLCSVMIVSNDHWCLNEARLCGMILKIAFWRLTTVSLLHPPSFSAAETLMDTRVATAELGWTAYPNSGVSRSLPTLRSKTVCKVCPQILSAGRQIWRYGDM